MEISLSFFVFLEVLKVEDLVKPLKKRALTPSSIRFRLNYSQGKTDSGLTKKNLNWETCPK